MNRLRMNRLHMKRLRMKQRPRTNAARPLEKRPHTKQRTAPAGGQMVAIAARVLYASLFGVGLGDTSRILGGIVHDHGTRRVLQGSVFPASPAAAPGHG